MNLIYEFLTFHYKSRKCMKEFLATGTLSVSWWPRGGSQDFVLTMLQQNLNSVLLSQSIQKVTKMRRQKRASQH